MITPTERLYRAARVMHAYTVPELQTVAQADRKTTVRFCRRMVRLAISRVEAIRRTANTGRGRHYVIVADAGPKLPEALL